MLSFQSRPSRASPTCIIKPAAGILTRGQLEVTHCLAPPALLPHKACIESDPLLLQRTHLFKQLNSKIYLYHTW